MKAGYFKHQLFATSSIDPMLRNVFDDANVTEIDPFNVSAKDLEGLDLLVLPGITGEASPYPTVLPVSKADIIMRACENNGLVIWTDCAATYWSAKEIHYEASSGAILTKQGLGWIDATAKGPLMGKGVRFMPEYDYSNVTTVEIDYHDTANRPFNTRICYSNSPSLYLSETEQANPAVDIVARFSDHEDKPIAAMTKVRGNGLIVSLGVLPQLKPENLQGRMSDIAHERHRLELFNTAAKYSAGINHFESVLLGKISRHWENTGRNPLPYLERLYA